MLAAEAGVAALRLPSITLLRMFALNAVVCGLEFCVSAAFCYIPPLLLKAGIEEQNMTLVLAVGPALGFFLVPMIGRASDRCRSSLGRRRPFILLLSITLISSLLVVSFYESIGILLFGPGMLGVSTSMALLVLGSVMLDFSCQACLTPCEAMLSDASDGTGQHDRCFTVYSLAISVGGCVGYLITALDWRGSSIGEYFGSQERSVFMLLILLYSVSLMTTFVSIHEVPLSPDDATPAAVSLDTSPHDPGYVSDEIASSDDCLYAPVDKVLDGDGVSKKRRQKDQSVSNSPFLRVSFVSTFLRHVVRMRRIVGARLYNSLPEGLRALFNVPLVLRRLAVANFCSWTAIMAFNLFYTDFVGQRIYEGDPQAAPDSVAREMYDRGVRSGSWGLLFHCISSALYAPIVERLAVRYGLGPSYLVGMLSFTVSMTLMLFSKNIYVVNLLAACTGFAYASLTTIPFMLITAYHNSKEVYFYDTIVGSSIPSRGFGTDLSTLDSAYFLSQVILTVCMGSLVHLAGSVAAYIMCACVMGVIACVCVTRIVSDKTQMHAIIRSSS